MAKSPIDHISTHAALGEAIIAAVKASGIMRKARRVKKAKATTRKRKKNPLKEVKAAAE